MCDIITHWHCISPESHMLQVQVIRIKTKTMTKNSKEIKTNIFFVDKCQKIWKYKNPPSKNVENDVLGR